MRLLRRLLTVLLILLALTVAAWWAFQRFVGDIALNLEPAMLQQRLAERFPLRNCQLVLACIEFSQPLLSLPPDGDRLQLDTQLSVQAGGLAFPGRAGLSGKLRYAQDAGAFYLDDLAVTDLELNGVPEKYAALVRARAPQAMQAALRDRPVYVIDTATTTGALARWAVRDVRVVNGRLRVTLFKSGA